jgi:predicted GNAT family acetyltransferase
MIRKLNELDRSKVLDYLYKDASLNIFIIGDIEAFGFEQEFQSIYGEFDQKNKYKSVLLFYRENAVFYSHIDHFNLEWLTIINENKFSYFNGRVTLMELIYPHLKDFDYKEMYFAEAFNIKSLENDELLKPIKLETREDATKIYYLLETVDEFGVNDQELDYFIEGKMKGLNMGSTYYLEENNKAISTVAATAETTINAIVVGVATHESARNRGLATKLMIHLMNEYKQKNKYLCLFYDNPKAGAIYKRLGFKDTEKWVMMNKR